MGSFHIHIPRGEISISEMLSRVPRAFRDQAEKGFTILATVSPDHYAEILRAAVVAVQSRRPPLEELEKALDLSKSDISMLFSAAMLTVPVVGQDGGDTSNDFIAAAVRGRIIAENIAEKVRPFVDTVVAERTKITRAIQRGSLPNQVFPSLTNFEVAVDLRMLFEKDAVAEGIAVAVMHLDTDADGEEIWFQASRDQLEQLKDDIEDALKKMGLAETWGQRESKS
jgi:hypothetical protein